MKSLFLFIICCSFVSCSLPKQHSYTEARKITLNLYQEVLNYKNSKGCLPQDLSFLSSEDKELYNKYGITYNSNSKEIQREVIYSDSRNFFAKRRVFYIAGETFLLPGAKINSPEAANLLHLPASGVLSYSYTYSPFNFFQESNAEELSCTHTKVTQNKHNNIIIFTNMHTYKKIRGYSDSFKKIFNNTDSSLSFIASKKEVISSETDAFYFFLKR